MSNMEGAKIQEFIVCKYKKLDIDIWRNRVSYEIYNLGYNKLGWQKQDRVNDIVFDRYMKNKDEEGTKMIKISHIAPLELMHISEDYSDIHLLLTHWAMQSQEYLEFYRNSKKYKILDNSFYELKSPIQTKQLLEIARSIKADEVVAPDYMYDRKRTLQSLQEFIKENNGEFKVMAVVCGKTFHELVLCFDEMNNTDGVDIIAISKHGYKESGTTYLQNRQKFLQHIVSVAVKPIHLLGVNSISEMYYPYPSIVRSIDSKYFARLATDDKIDLYTKCSDEQMRLYQYLMKWFKDNEQKQKVVYNGEW